MLCPRHVYSLSWSAWLCIALRTGQQLCVCLHRCGPGLNDSLDDSAVSLSQNAKDLSSGNSGWVKRWPAVTI